MIDEADSSGKSVAEEPETSTCCRIRDGAASEVKVLESFSQAVIRVVECLAPAVVSITSRMVFRDDGRAVESQGAGSGAVIAPDGYILTNSHVVHNAREVSVHFTDGSVLPAEIVGEDPPTDLAALKVLASGLSYAQIGDSNALKVGQLVIAIGNPLGLESTVSTGVVSSLGRAIRSISGRLIENIVQHTAPLNPGSSGGPLVNTRGQVVGINTAIIAAAQGIGFSIPSNTASWVLSRLMTKGRVARSFLGIAGAPRPLSRRTVRALNLSTDHAVIILQVVRGGPADRAGLQTGDLVIRIGDRDVATMDDVFRFLTEWPAGKPVTVTILRLGQQLAVDVEPAEAAPDG